jgi:hypothetical protein
MQVRLYGTVVWAFVVEQDGGLRARFSADDWERLNLFRGQRVAVRLPSTTVVDAQSGGLAPRAR